MADLMPLSMGSTVSSESILSEDVRSCDKKLVLIGEYCSRTVLSVSEL